MNATANRREIKLGVGRYTMAVAHIQENVKSFQSRDGMRVRHDIYFRDEERGIEYKGEYLTDTFYQGDFVVGELCCFEVTNERMNEIRKCDSLLIAKGGPDTSRDIDEGFGVTVAGKSQTLALQFAKDIAVAQISLGQFSGMEDDFMANIFRNAWKMNCWLLDPVEPTQPPF